MGFQPVFLSDIMFVICFWFCVLVLVLYLALAAASNLYLGNEAYDGAAMHCSRQLASVDLGGPRGGPGTHRLGPHAQLELWSRRMQAVSHGGSQFHAEADFRAKRGNFWGNLCNQTERTTSESAPQAIFLVKF